MGGVITAHTIVMAMYMQVVSYSFMRRELDRYTTLNTCYWSLET